MNEHCGCASRAMYSHTDFKFDRMLVGEEPFNAVNVSPFNPVNVTP